MYSNAKSKMLQIRMTPEEHKRLVKLASIVNISLAEWIRRAIAKG